jgi:isopropylmalate/homocitrate/citramalate synthase
VEFDNLHDAETCLKYWIDHGGVDAKIQFRTLSLWRKVDEAPEEAIEEATAIVNLFVNMTDILQQIVAKWEICRDLRDTMDAAKAAVSEAHRMRAERS